MSWGGPEKKNIGVNSTFRSVCSDRLLESKVLAYLISFVEAPGRESRTSASDW